MSILFMKSKLLFGLLSVFSLALIWCSEPAWNDKVDDEDWFNIAEWYCENEWWKIEMWEELNGYQPVCFYADDESYCYLEYLYNGLCSKWEFYYFDDYSYVEQVCIESNGQISQTDDWEDICILNDEEFCYMSDIMDWACDLLYQDYDYYEDLAVCDAEWENIVCWTDWNTYFNKCYLYFAWVEEETAAEVVDGVCVFG